MAKSRKKEGINLFTIVIVIIVIFVIAAILINVNKDENEGNNETQQQTQNGQTTSENQEEQIEEKYVEVLEDGTKLNTSSKLKANKKLDDLEIMDIQLTYKDGITTLLATVKNNQNRKTEFTEVEIELIDENGEKIYTLQGVIQDVEAGGTVKLNTSITADFANAYDFKITKK